MFMAQLDPTDRALISGQNHSEEVQGEFFDLRRYHPKVKNDYSGYIWLVKPDSCGVVF